MPKRTDRICLTVLFLLAFHPTAYAQKKGSSYVPPDDVGRFRDNGVGNRNNLRRGENSPLPVAGGNRQSRASWTVSLDNPLETVADLYTDFDLLKKDTQPVVVILDTQHPFIVDAQRMMNTGVVAWINELKRTVAELSGLPVRLIHYTQIEKADVQKSNIKALFITARLKEIAPRYDRTLYDVIRTTQIPTLGICGGQSHITNAFGGRMALMPPLQQGDNDPFPPYEPGTSKEWGFGPIRIHQEDPLFAGLGEEAVVRHYHAAHISRMPESFVNLASSDATKFQAIKHTERPIYGVMFHVELYDNEHNDGRTILNNFFRIAGIKAQDSSIDQSVKTGPTSPRPQPAIKQENTLPPIDLVFERIDRNQDGKLTTAEIPEQRRSVFMRADSNGDGEISRDELIAARQRAKDQNQ